MNDSTFRRVSVLFVVVLVWILAGGPLLADPPQTADLSFINGCGPLVSPAGGHVSCSATVVNRGPGRARDVTIVDHLPANVVRSSLPSGCRVGPFNIVRCRVGDLAAGESTSVRFLIDAPPPGVFKNTGAAIAPIFDRNYRDSGDQAFFAIQEVSPSPFVGGNLGIDSEVLDSDFFPQNQVFFRHTVTNHGPDTARGAGFLSTLGTFGSQFRVTSVTSSSSMATCNLHNSRPVFDTLPIPTQLLDRVNADCSIGDLPPGVSVDFIFGIQPQQPETRMIYGGAGVFSNTADFSLVNNETLFSFPRCNPIGDANGDGIVNSVDLAIVNSHLGKTVSAADPVSAAADVDGDGQVDENDLAVVIANTTVPADVEPDRVAENPKYGFGANAIGNIRDFLGTFIGERDGNRRQDLADAFGLVEATRTLTPNAPPGTTTGIGFTNFYSNVQNNDPSTVYLTTGAGTCVAVIFLIPDAQGRIGEIRIAHIDATNDAEASIEAAGPFPGGTRAIVFGGDDNYEDSRVTMQGVKSKLEELLGRSNVDYFAGGDSLGVDSQGNLYAKPRLNRAPTTTSLSSTPNPSAEGQAVTFTASVTSAGGIPTGTVTLRDGTTELGTATLDGNGQATFTIDDLTAGNHSITAEYSGDDEFIFSTSPPLSQVVNPRVSSTSTDLDSSPNPSTFGQAVTFTASVSSSGGTPTGSVTFRDGTAVIGTAAPDANGRASFTTTGLATGTHSVTAEYGGDGNFDGSTSPALTQVVDRADTTISLVSSPNPSSVGQPVLFLATITSPGGAPTGVMSIFDENTPIGTVPFSLGQASFTLSTLTAGTHEITVVYAGDADFNGSTSNGVTQIVNP